MRAVCLLFAIINLTAGAVHFGPSCFHLTCAVGEDIYQQQNWASRDQLKNEKADEGACILIFKHTTRNGKITINDTKIDANVYKKSDHNLGVNDIEFDKCYEMKGGNQNETNIACICQDRNHCHLDLEYWIPHAYAGRTGLDNVRTTLEKSNLPTDYEHNFCFMWIHLWLSVAGGIILLMAIVVCIVCCTCCGVERRERRRERKRSHRKHAKKSENTTGSESSA